MQHSENTLCTCTKSNAVILSSLTYIKCFCPQLKYVSFTYSLSYMSILYGFITNSQNDQFPVGLIAQLVEHCNGIAEVMASISIQAWIFSGFLSIRYCSSSVNNCGKLQIITCFCPQFKYVSFTH